jgi:hypothetical protein
VEKIKVGHMEPDLHRHPYTITSTATPTPISTQVHGILLSVYLVSDPSYILYHYQPASSHDLNELGDYHSTEPSVTPNDLPEHVLDHVMFKLVTASQTNAKHLILHIISVAYFKNHQIFTWLFTDQEIG